MTNQEKINEFILKHCENCDNKNTEKRKSTMHRRKKYKVIILKIHKTVE